MLTQIAANEYFEFLTGYQMHRGECNLEHYVRLSWFPQGADPRNNPYDSRHDTWQSACAKRQLLCPEQEDTLMKWYEH